MKKASFSRRFGRRSRARLNRRPAVLERAAPARNADRRRPMTLMPRKLAGDERETLRSLVGTGRLPIASGGSAALSQRGPNGVQPPGPSGKVVHVFMHSHALAQRGQSASSRPAAPMPSPNAAGTPCRAAPRCRCEGRPRLRCALAVSRSIYQNTTGALIITTMRRENRRCLSSRATPFVLIPAVP
jgi:hypothetical protein